MTAFADLHELVNRATGGNSGAPEFISWHKESRVGGAAAATPIAGQPISLWQYEGSPSHGAAPTGSMVNPTNATAGALKQTDPGGGRQKWLLSGFANSSAQGVITIYDRLATYGGLNATTTTAQTINLTLSRYTDGVGVQAFIEINTQIGATGTTITAAYHNTANASQTSQAVTFGATNRREAQRWFPISLASGDTGVLSLESVTVLATTGTAGDFAVVLARKITSFPISAVSRGMTRTYLDSLLEIKTGACLFATFTPSSTTVGVFDGDLFMAER
jgi:hypothetical protein